MARTDDAVTLGQHHRPGQAHPVPAGLGDRFAPAQGDVLCVTGGADAQGQHGDEGRGQRTEGDHHGEVRNLGRYRSCNGLQWHYGIAQ